MKLLILSAILLLVLLSTGCTGRSSPSSNDRTQSYGTEYNELFGIEEYDTREFIVIDQTYRNEFDQIVISFDHPVSCSMSLPRVFFFYYIDDYEGVSVEYEYDSVVITDRFGVVHDGYLLKVE